MKGNVLFIILPAFFLTACSREGRELGPDEDFNFLSRDIPHEFLVPMTRAQSLTLESATSTGGPYGFSLVCRVALKEKTEEEVSLELKSYISDVLKQRGAAITGGGTSSSNGFSLDARDERCEVRVFVTFHPVDDQRILIVVIMMQNEIESP